MPGRGARRRRAPAPTAAITAALADTLVWDVILQVWKGSVAVEFDGQLWILEGNPMDTALIRPVDRFGRTTGMAIWVKGGFIKRSGQVVGTARDLVLHRKPGGDHGRLSSDAGTVSTDAGATGQPAVPR